MPADESILDLLAEWSAAREAGRPLSAEQLCRDRPERLGELRLESEQAYSLETTPADQEQLTLHIETWTGLTLEGNDVRMLPRDEWQRRHDKLALLGWHDEPSALQPEPYQPPPEMKEPIVIESGIDNLSRIVFSGDGKFLATSSNKQTKVWDAATQKLVQDFPGQNTGSLAICLTRDGKQFITGGGAGLRWWNVETGKLERTIKFEGNVIDIALSPDEQFLAIVQMRARTVHVLRRETGELVQAFELPINRPARESKAHSQTCFSPDGKLLIAACGGRAWPDFVGEDSAIAVWEVDSWKLRTSFTADKYNLLSLEISPDSDWIAAASHGGKTAKLWKMPSGPDADVLPVKEIAMQHGPNSVAFSRDGKLLAHSSHTAQEGTVLVQRLDTGTKIVIPTFDGAYDLAFSPDGKQLATGSRNGTVSQWDVNDLSGAAGNNSQPGKPVTRP